MSYKNKKILHINDDKNTIFKTTIYLTLLVILQFVNLCKTKALYKKNTPCF